MSLYLQRFANTPKGRDLGKNNSQSENTKFTLLHKLYHDNKGVIIFLQIMGEAILIISEENHREQSFYEMNFLQIKPFYWSISVYIQCNIV